MKEYIERAALKRELAPYEENDFSQQMDVILAIVDAQPAADVAPVRHGRWLKRSNGTPYCSNCDANERDTYSAVVNECTFCYSCGARMDKEDEHEAD